MAKHRTSPTNTRALLPCGRPAPVKGKAALHGHMSFETWQKQLNDYLKEKELNQSESRNRILEVILREARHFNVGTLVEKVHQSYPNIGAATVYRNIPTLLEAGIIRETLMDNEGQKVYEVQEEDHHDHIVCIDCQEIFEFHEEIIEEAQSRVSHKLKFEPLHHRHVIYAKCEYRKSV